MVLPFAVSLALHCAHAHMESQTKPQSLWASHCAQIDREHTEQLATLQEEERTLQDVREADVLEQVLEQSIRVEKARAALSWTSVYQTQLASLAEVHERKLQAQTEKCFWVPP